MDLIGGITSFIFAAFQLLLLVVFKLYGWVVIVAVLFYMAWQNTRKRDWVENNSETILLRIDVPKDNEKKELSAEQMFAALHGILRPKADLLKEGSLQEHISFELVSKGDNIQFYIWAPKHLKDFVESQVYAQYPTVQIKEGLEDYAATEIGERAIYGAELKLNKADVLPIKTFDSFEVDPLAGITGVLASLNQPGEEVWIQILARPIDDSWQDKGKEYVDQIKNGKAASFRDQLIKAALELPIHIFSNFISAMMKAPEPPKKEEKKKDDDEKKLSTGQQALIKAVGEKTTKLGYEVKIRIAYLGPDPSLAKSRIQAMVGSFKQFNTTNLNGFDPKGHYNSADYIEDYRARLFLDTGSILNIAELASLYHLPHTSVETPNMTWTSTKTSEPPANVPAEGTTDALDVSLFGLSNFRGRQLKFGIKRRDRGRHFYIIGQTGAGKSMLLQLLTLSDVYHDIGFAIVDPHGDYATDIMKYIPEHRVKDVVYFNATDREHPMAFNPMEVTDPAIKNHIASELVGVLKRMFEAQSWGPRLEYILRYTVLALLDHEGATMLDITRMLNEKDFRKQVIRDITDPVVKTFWVTEFASWNEKFASEAVAPVLNKVGAFVANPLVRNIIGQTKSSFNIRRIMDEGKILVVNLSRGQVGEDNAAILGALMVTKIQLAAMSRADMPLEQRRPFYLYVDEFQNFATDSFAVILSEARKYGLNLTVANQYVSQMPEVVRDAVFGNVGTIVSFRVGPGDAKVLGEYFEPVFEATDLTRLNNQNIFLSMIINGEKAAPFSASTLRMPDPEHDYTPQIVELSRTQYTTPRGHVEDDIRTRTQETQDEGTRAVGASAAAGQPALSGSASLGDQKPNTPKSEFLAGLQNPNLPPVQHQPRREGRGDGRGGQSKHSGGGGGGGFKSHGGHSGGGNQQGGGGGDRRDQRPRPEHSDQRNQAVREAIQAIQAAQAHAATLPAQSPTPAAAPTLVPSTPISVAPTPAPTQSAPVPTSYEQ